MKRVSLLFPPLAIRKSTEVLPSFSAVSTAAGGVFKTTNAERFVSWLGSQLLRRLKKGDVLVLDNLKAHHDKRVVPLCAGRGVRVVYLAPYSHDFNPIEPGWGHQKQYVRKHAPRTSADLLRVARRARHRITPRHCRNWFAHSGYSVQLN